ncbi:MAG: TldD/PmbA family protein, partial [Sphingomonas sp.]|uniref:metallopeptidase TldD-related protein n=1 Tax=Sphingomonas sp. TaxID=28214 RepID=UPI002590C9F8
LAAARTAAAIASGAPAKAPADLTVATLPRHYDTEYDWSAVGVDAVMPLLRKLDTDLRAADPLVKRAEVRLSTSQKRIMVVDSAGRMSADSQPMTRLWATLVMEKDGERQSNRHNIAARRSIAFYDDTRLARFVKTTVDRTRILFEARKPPAGELPVVMAAGSSGILLHEAIGHGMEADFNRRGTSIFSDRIGKRVASELITIVDSGLDQG